MKRLLSLVIFVTVAAFLPSCSMDSTWLSSTQKGVVIDSNRVVVDPDSKASTDRYLSKAEKQNMDGIRYTVRTETGKTVSVTQGTRPEYYVGEHVIIVANNRLVPDKTLTK